MAALTVLQVGSDIAQLQPEIIKPQSAPLIEVEASPLLTKITGDVDMLLEDSLDGGPPSVGSGDIPAPIGVVAGSTMSTPISSKKKSNNRKLVTGYILYSSEVRKQVAQNNPDSTFGEISRIVGNEWRSLPAGEKQAWEERAARCNEENAAKMSGDGEQCSSPAPILQLAPLPDQIYECCWDTCDYQFEEITDCIDHCIQEGSGHVQAHFQGIPTGEAEFQCHWRGCGRLKKSMPPFPTLARLARHVREVHINKGNGKVVPPNDRSKNFITSSRHQYTATVKPTVGINPILASSAVQVKPQEPLFVAVPPRPQRVLHSEAYIKYIEGLSADNKFISPWEKTLNATCENTPAPDSEKLSSSMAWLSNGAGNHGSILNALWALRDYMVKDSLNLYKNL